MARVVTPIDPHCRTWPPTDKGHFYVDTMLTPKADTSAGFLVRSSGRWLFTNGAAPIHSVAQLCTGSSLSLYISSLSFVIHATVAPQANASFGPIVGR